MSFASWCVLQIIISAFEPISESPWLYGGIAASLFPKTPLVVSVNPAAVGLLEENSLSISASRPFGFRDLDRSAIAGCSSGGKYSCAGLLNYSGRNGYSEVTANCAAAVGLRPGIVAGLSLSWHRLQIEGYGSAGAVSSDLGVIARPVTGFYLGGAVRGLYSSPLSNSGMGAVPRTVSAALGVCPVKGVLLSAGASMHQYSGKEFSVVSSVEPYPGVCLSFSFLSPPVRMGMGLSVSISALSTQYGYATHPELESSHSICLAYGSSGFHPEPFSLLQAEEIEEAAIFPLNINTATEEDLVCIPGICPSKASTIRNYVESYGPLETIDQMIEIPGIGSTTLENLRPYLTI